MCKKDNMRSCFHYVEFLSFGVERGGALYDNENHTGIYADSTGKTINAVVEVNTAHGCGVKIAPDGTLFIMR